MVVSLEVNVVTYNLNIYSKLGELPYTYTYYVGSLSMHIYTHRDQWRNVACWRPSAPTAPPFLAPLPHLKSKAKLNKLSYFRKYATKIYKNVCF